jgi:hypothetical protein
MSSPPESPSPLPGGPARSPAKDASIAINQENTVPAASLPHPSVNGAEKGVQSNPKEITEPRNPAEVVQVPSTAPVTTAANKPAEAPQSAQVESRRTENVDEASSDSDTVASEGAGTDLPVFDWVDLQQRYTKAIQAVNQEEEDLLEEFYKYSDVGFQVISSIRIVLTHSAGFLCLGRCISKS